MWLIILASYNTPNVSYYTCQYLGIFEGMVLGLDRELNG